jgi:DNA replication protein DnaC
MTNKAIASSIEELTKKLRLPATRKYFKEYAQDAALRDINYEEYLLSLLEKECEVRAENAITNRIRRAQFPYKKYIEELQVEHLPQDGQKKLRLLKSLNFIETGQNVILAGNPGTGKSHIAIGLGIKACMEGYKVWYTSVPSLVNLLKETRSEQTLRAFENRFLKYDLIIADELGYISFDKEGSELLFTHLSLRAGQKSTIITTNLSFERWDEIFQDPVMTAAMVDRLTHKSYFINMNGSSYRMKETKEWLEKERLSEAL